MAKRGVGFNMITGLVRYTEVLALEPLAVCGATVCRLFEFMGPSSIEGFEADPTFPKPITPTGGEKRWVLTELRQWAIDSAPRFAAKGGWTANQRAGQERARARRRSAATTETEAVI